MRKKNNLGLSRTTFYKKPLIAGNGSSRNHLFYRGKWSFIKSGAGFTLAELLIVIALIGLLTTMVVVNFRRGNFSNDLRQVSIELSQNLRLAQQYTIGGNSILLCSDNSTHCTTEGDPCLTNSAVCRSGVPQGGYGAHFGSNFQYTIFGDITDNGLLDSGDDTSVIVKRIDGKGIHISFYQLEGQTATVPDPSSPLNIVFDTPQGTIHFITLDSGGNMVDNINSNILRILVTSDNIAVCRTVSINRISGQISETQSDCSL